MQPTLLVTIAGGWRGCLGGCAGFSVALPPADIALMYDLGPDFAIPGGPRAISPPEPGYPDAAWDSLVFFFQPKVASDAYLLYSPGVHEV